MRKLILGLMCIGLTGCPPNKPAPTGNTNPGGVTPAHTGGRTDLDPQPDVPVVINLSIYHVAVPVRSISASSAFWKHVDENSLDVDTKDLMQFNGFRVGLASQSDWDYFKAIFNKQSLISQKSGGTAMNGPSVVDMPFRQNIDREYIAWFDPAYQLAGQTFDRCDNWMVVRFEPVRRTPGTVRVKLTPKVRSQRTELRYTVLEKPIESTLVRPEYLWDVLAQIDIPLDHFLVVAPTPEKSDGPTLGHNFLVADGDGEQSEHLLVISPQPFRIDTSPEAPTTKPAGR